MQRPWILAFLSLAIAPDTAAIALPLDFNPAYSTLSHRQVVREKRGFGIEINHASRQITLRSWFFAARNTPAERQQLEAILQFWHRQNGRFVYRLGRGKQAVDYDIVFDLREAEGAYEADGIFIPVAGINLSLLNQIEVVPDHHMPKLRQPSPAQTLVGYAPNNFIYISDQVADQPWVGVHEAGHRLGAGHVNHGIMQQQGDFLKRKVSRRTIRQMLACGYIIGRSHQRQRLVNYPVEAAQIDVVGTVPRGFYTRGRVKRR